MSKWTQTVRYVCDIRKRAILEVPCIWWQFLWSASLILFVFTLKPYMKKHFLRQELQSGWKTFICDFTADCLRYVCDSLSLRVWRRVDFYVYYILQNVSKYKTKFICLYSETIHEKALLETRTSIRLENFHLWFYCRLFALRVWQPIVTCVTACGFLCLLYFAKCKFCCFLYHVDQ